MFCILYAAAAALHCAEQTNAIIQCCVGTDRGVGLGCRGSHEHVDTWRTRVNAYTQGVYCSWLAN